jgi:hypothetical protein
MILAQFYVFGLGGIGHVRKTNDYQTKVNDSIAQSQRKLLKRYPIKSFRI